MERIFLLHELISVDDVVKLITSYMMFIHSDFVYGRLYQLVRDKSTNIIGSQYRKREKKCEEYMDALSFEDTVKEAYSLLQRAYKFRKYSEWYGDRTIQSNGWDDVEVGNHKAVKDSFYVGRCIQFILDSDSTVDIKSLLVKENDHIVREAHDKKNEMLLPQEGERLEFRDCEDCDGWEVGDNRCLCGNRRCCLEQKSWVSSLDDSSISYYVTTR